MKKILFTLVIGLALFAKADYIYWMVDNPASGTDISNASTTFSWENAVISVQETDDIYVNSTYPASSSVGTLTKEQASEYKNSEAYALASIGNDFSGKYILIELFANDGSWMAGYSAQASSLARYITGGNSMSVMPATGFGTALSGASYAVPEPTSGLLFIIGGVLLGLKRRREVV